MATKLQLTLSQACDGFFLEKRAQHRSPHTLADYANAFRRLRLFLQADPLVTVITAEQISTFLRELGERPQTFGGVAPRAPKPLSKKTIRNIHTALSSLWSWAVAEGYADEHILRSVSSPKAEKRAIVPYTKEDVKAMLAQCEHKREHRWRDHEGWTQRRPTSLRDEAIILLLLDTGMRASELCHLHICDLDLANQRTKVFGKGRKERILPIGRRTGKALWRYLITRADKAEDAPLFVMYGEVDEPMTRSSLYLLIRRLGDRAGIVPKAGVHRFRHTFAITFLRNGGNAYSLQALLGHSSLEMVRTYLSIVQADTENEHRRASPVDRWRL